MEVFKVTKKVSPEVPMSFFNFERFERQCGDFVLVDARINFALLDAIRERKIVYFEIEEPNRFGSSDPAFRREKYEDYFYRILSVCPHTTEWLNKAQGKARRQFVFFPFNENLIPPPAEKKYDVIYFGGVNSREIFRMVKTIAKFNYRFVGPSESKAYKIVQNLRAVRKLKKILRIPAAREKYITDKDVSHLEKLKLISQSKVTIVHNLLFYNAAGVRQLQKTPGFKDNKAFALIPNRNVARSIIDFLLLKEYIVPQQKTRLVEAALCRSLILCRKDPFNLVEKFFVPEREFIYYEEDKLEEKLNEVLAHYHAYAPVIERAFEKASREYTTQSFFEKYLKNLA